MPLNSAEEKMANIKFNRNLDFTFQPEDIIYAHEYHLKNPDIPFIRLKPSNSKSLNTNITYYNLEFLYINQVTGDVMYCAPNVGFIGLPLSGNVVKYGDTQLGNKFRIGHKIGDNTFGQAMMLIDAYYKNKLIKQLQENHDVKVIHSFVQSSAKDKARKKQPIDIPIIRLTIPAKPENDRKFSMPVMLNDNSVPAIPIGNLTKSVERKNKQIIVQPFSHDEIKYVNINKTIPSGSMGFGSTKNGLCVSSIGVILSATVTSLNILPKANKVDYISNITREQYAAAGVRFGKEDDDEDEEKEEDDNEYLESQLD